MLHPTSLILLSFVVLVSLVLDISKADPSEINNLHSPEAKEVTLQLKEEYDDVQESIDDYRKQFGSSNDLLDAVKAYRKAYTLAKGTKCAGKEPPSDADDDDLILSYIDGCEGLMSLDKLDVFAGKIATAKANVKKIDDTLHATCTSNPSSCDQAKEEANEQLNGILTIEFDEELKSAASAGLEQYKTSLDECFKSDTADLVNDLVQATEAIKTCSTTTT